MEAGNPAKVTEELQFCEATLPISHLSCRLGAQPHDPEQRLLQLH